MLHGNWWLLYIFLLTVGAQNSTRTITTTSVNVITPNATSTPSSTETHSDNSTDTPACTPGNSVGYMIIRQPNITSIMSVGTRYNISWDWSISVTKPPSFVDVKVQLIASGIVVTWKNVVIQRAPVEPRWFMWKPVGLVDGKYKLRLVPDGKETYNVPANQQPCFADGEAIPSVSAAFSISNSQGELASYPDQYPPNDSRKQTVSIWKLITMGVTHLMLGIGMTF